MINLIKEEQFGWDLRILIRDDEFDVVDEIRVGCVGYLD